MKTIRLTALMAASILATPAFAQAPTAADITALKAELDALRAKVDTLEKQLADTRAAATSTPLAAAPPPAPSPVAISWKGAPQFEDKATGFTFKPKGFVQFDSGRAFNPTELTSPSANFGNRTRLRRAVFGAEGTMPGGFGYKVEFNLADGTVGYEDVMMTWQPKGTPVLLTIGNIYPLSGLETLTSSRLTSFAERAESTEAFNFNRRLGATLALIDPRDRYTLTAGIFQTGITGDLGDDGWQASARATVSPTLGDDARLHLGVSYQHRRNRNDTPQARYRVRPFTQVTDFRFVDTSVLTTGGDDVLGVELGGIWGPVHVIAEGYKLWVSDYRARLDQGSQFFANGPGFTSGYAEIGWYLTGETRGYKTGRWDRTKVLKPLGRNGWGAFQLNARLDMVDLTDRVSPNVLVNGGRQTGYSLSAIWNPIDYIRFLAQYSHVEVQGGPIATIAVPSATLPAAERKYDTDIMVLRAQVEF